MLLRTPIAGPLIGDAHAGHSVAVLQPVPEACLRCCCLLPPTLHEHVADSAVLIDRSPPGARFLIDHEHTFIEVRFVAWGARRLRLVSIRLPKREHPWTDGLGRTTMPRAASTASTSWQAGETSMNLAAIFTTFTSVVCSA